MPPPTARAEWVAAGAVPDVVVPHPRRGGASAVAPAPVRRRDRTTWWCAAAGAAAGVALTLLSSRGLGDDSYITLDYARTLVEHGEWGLVPGHPANTATSPLNVWLLAAGLALSGSAAVAVGAVLAAALALVAVWCRWLGRSVGLGAAFPLIAVTLLATSPLLVSTAGLETYLGVAVVVGAARYAREDRLVAAGGLCGVAVLVRPDYAVPAVVLTLLVTALSPAGRPPWRRLGVGALTAAAVAAPWHVVAWVALGGFLPDTFAFKTGNPHGLLPAMLAELDTLYWSRTPTAVAITAVLVVAGWVAAAAWPVGRWRGRSSAPGALAFAFAAAGTAHVVALMVLNSYPQAWYYGPLVAGCALAVATVAATRATAVVLSVVAGYATVALAAAGQGGLPWTAAEMNSNFTTAGYYAEVGRDLPRLVGDAAVAPPGEIGAIAWFCRCAVLDHFSDRALARPVVDGRYSRSGALTRAVLDLDARFRPEGPAPWVAYRLRYVRGEEQPPPGVLHTWWVRSPQSGADFRIVLVRG